MAPNPIKVLVAEDEPTMLALLASHVRHLGFSVIEASEGDVAWRLLEEQGPDLVILDVMMPGMSGWDICKRLKSHTVGPLSRTGVIMLTGIGESLNDATSELFGADAWLNKPFEFVDLDRTIYATLASYGKRGSNAPGSMLNGSAKPTIQIAKRPAATKKAKPGARTAPTSTKSAAAKNGAAAKKRSTTKPAASVKNATATKKVAAKSAPAKRAPVKKAASSKKTAAKTSTSTKKAAAKTSTSTKKAAAKTSTSTKKAAAKTSTSTKKAAVKSTAAARKVAPAKTSSAKNGAAKKLASSTRAARPSGRTASVASKTAKRGQPAARAKR
jgi:DNA-binding response OmpR family regulator